MFGIKSRLLTGAAQAALGAIALASIGPAAHAVGAEAGADAAHPSSPTGQTVDAVVVTGVRGRPRTIANSPVPIDIISKAQLTETGKVGLKSIFSSVIPSFNVPAQNGGGTSASACSFCFGDVLRAM